LDDDRGDSAFELVPERYTYLLIYLLAEAQPEPSTSCYQLVRPTQAESVKTDGASMCMCKNNRLP